MKGDTGEPLGGAHSGKRWDETAWRACDRPRSGGHADRILLKGGIVLSMDPAIGDLWNADVLIEGKTIVAVGTAIDAKDAQIVECGGLVIMPGFVNTHHHQYYTAQRAILSDGILFGAWPQESYFSLHEITTTGQMRDARGQVIWDLGRSPYDPEDCYIAELLASVNQIDQGVTTGIDTSQSCHTPAHTDALIEGIRASGRRTLYAFSYGRHDQPGYEHPGRAGDPDTGLARLRRDYFASDDQLVTLGLNVDHFLFTGFVAADVAYARSLGAPLIQHGGPLPGAITAGLLGPDCVFIHGTSGDPMNPALSPEVWRAVADSGAHVSIARSSRCRWRSVMASRRSRKCSTTASCRA